MAKFTYNDIVKVKATAQYCREAGGNKKSGLRIGERAWICGISESKAPDLRQSFPSGFIYLIEFEDGDAIDVHEDDLEGVDTQGSSPRAQAE